MKSKKLYVYVGIVLFVIAVIFVLKGPNKDQQPADPIVEIVQPKLQPKPPGKIADREVPALPADRPEPRQEFQPRPFSSEPEIARTEVQVDEVLMEIEEVANSYDAKELPILESYLYDPDPKIREAALDGMLRLGDAAASPMLRSAAAENVDNPHEAVEMLDAADFLELPDAKLPSLDTLDLE